MAFTVDGMCEREVNDAMKRLGALLAQKWYRPRSEMIGYVISWMDLAVVKANTMLLRGSRVERIRALPFGLEKTGMGNRRYVSANPI